MKTEWKSQQGDGMYTLQFETDNRQLYKAVEKACQNAIDATHIFNENAKSIAKPAEWVFIGSTEFGDGYEEIVEECPVCQRRVYRYSNQEQDNFCPKCGTHLFSPYSMCS